MIFFKKDKKKKLSDVQTIQHPVLGSMQKQKKPTSWKTDEEQSVSLFGKISKVSMWFNTSSTSEGLLPEQESSLSYFLKNRDEMRQTAEKTLVAFFNVEGPDAIKEHIEAGDVYFTKQGKIAMALKSTLSEEFTNQQIVEEVIFDSDFGISIYPEVQVLPNEQDFAVFTI